jgi:hypothetical protein
MIALDLSQTVPRSPYAELAGIPWLPRVIDKARASFAGTHADYVAYPCSTDRVFLACIGVDASALGDYIRSGADDDAIAAWVGSRASRLKLGLGLFRGAVLNPSGNPLVRAVVRAMTPETRARVLRRHPDADSRLLTCIGALLALDEGYPVEIG